MTDPRDEGCLCYGCDRRYRVDVMVPDDLWERIKPPLAARGGGLLCGRCIFDRIEALGEFASWVLGSPEAPRT